MRAVRALEARLEAGQVRLVDQVQEQHVRDGRVAGERILDGSVAGLVLIRLAAEPSNPEGTL